MRTALSSCFAAQLGGLVVAGALVGALATPLGAHAQEVRALHRIEVYQANDVCYYQIQDQANQDLFRITPLGAVVFQVRGGLKTRVEIADAQTSQGNVAGAAAEKTADLDTNRPVQSIAVRGARGASTEHKVQIQCCADRRLFRCQWTDAEPASATQDIGGLMGDGVYLGAPLGMTRRGPSATGPVLMDRVPPLPPMGPGGPVMKIVE